MINKQRRTVLKSISLLAALPVVSLATLGTTTEKTVMANTSQQIKTITLTNLTPKTVKLDSAKPISIAETTQLKINAVNARGAVLQPGGQVSFDIVASNDKTDLLVDMVEIKSNQPEFNGSLPVMGSDVQISMI